MPIPVFPEIVPSGPRIEFPPTHSLPNSNSPLRVNTNYSSPIEYQLFWAALQFNAQVNSRSLSSLQLDRLYDHYLQALEANIAVHTSTERVEEILDHALTLGLLSATENLFNTRSNTDSRLVVNQQPIPPQTSRPSLWKQTISSLKRFIATGTFARFSPPPAPFSRLVTQ